MSGEQLEFNIGEDEKPATVALDGDGGNAEVLGKEPPPVVETSTAAASPKTVASDDDELGEYSDKVKKRIDKLTARLRETQRREQAAIEYAQQVQRRAQELERAAQQSDAGRLDEAKTRIETQAVALKQIIRKAREEGDTETEMEAQERLASIMYDQRQVAEQAAARQAQIAQQTQMMPPQAQPQQQYRQPVQQETEPDPQAEDWAERNRWFGRDVAMTAAVRGIHMQLITQEGFDPNSNEYYDELDRRMRDAFPHKFADQNSAQQNNRTTRPVQTVAPAARSSGVNNARRTVRLSPSQVAIAKKLGVPLEEYAKYVKE
jgi:hypothetical protein